MGTAQIIAILIQEGSRLYSDYLRTKPLPRPEIKLPEFSAETLEAPVIKTEEGVVLRVRTKPEPEPESVQPIADEPVAIGCLPCAIGHLSACSGMLNEAMRFAYKDGVSSPEAINRVNTCIDELNAMERKDLTPEKIVGLPKWEKDIAHDALLASRDVRLKLEDLSTTEDLENVAAQATQMRQRVGQAWFQSKFHRLSEPEKNQVAQKLLERLEANSEDEEPSITGTTSMETEQSEPIEMEE